MTQWECTVCGYIHSGANPPDICPVCGADVSKFKEVAQARVSLFQEMRETFQPHAVAGHFPNALVPTALLFTAVALFVTPLSLSDATWYMLLVLLPMIPATLLTGLYEWKSRFAGKTATIFQRKIQLASLLMFLLVITVGLRYSLGDPLLGSAVWKWGFCGLLLAMLGCVTLLGHYGGKLVFSLMNRN